MALPRNADSKDIISFAESKDITEQTPSLSCPVSGDESQPNREDTSNVVICSHVSSHNDTERAKTTVGITVKGSEIYISGFSVVQIGCNTNVLKVQSCKWCSKNCYSSSDEENNSVMSNNQEVEADSYAHDDVFKHVTKCSDMIYSPMPIIPKRGCLNATQYMLVITELKDLQDEGDFVAHEQMVQKQIALAADPDMQASVHIERAMALYFQNNIKDAKKILKIVLKQEPNLKNPGILGGRALNLLTAVYKREGKFGNAMTCVEKATTCLEGQDSPDDKAELHHSYGALITAMPAAKDLKTRRATKEEAYKTYEMACHCTTNDEFKEYVHVKMAAMLLNSRSNAIGTDRLLSKEDVMKAKKHLDLVESRVSANNMAEEPMALAIGTRIKLLILRSDQYLGQQNVAMAMEKAREASELIHRHDFKLEFVSAKKRVDILAAKLRQENEDCWDSSSNGYIADEGGNSE